MLLRKGKQQKEVKPITSEQYRKLFLFLSFFVPLEMMLMVFARSIVFPFGEDSFLYSDLYHQYFPFFVEFARKVRAGEGIFYSWNIGMGTNFYAIYAYYLASPLNWLVFLFPEKYLLEAVSYLVVFKVGLAGLTSYLFFSNRSKGDKSTRTGYCALLFSFCYAMSGYVAAYNISIMWMDCIVLAPLIVLGLERLVKEGKVGVYTFFLALSIFTNFYLSILICIFLVLYFFLLFSTEERKMGTIWRFTYSSLLAGGMAAIILVPVGAFMMIPSIDQMPFPKHLEFYFSIFKEFARHCMMLKTSGDNGIYPNLYCGTGVFLFLPLYVMNKEIPVKRKVAYLALILFFLLSFMTNILDYIWHGMNFPSGFPARQSFLYVLILLAMGYDCIMHIDSIRAKFLWISYAIAALFLVSVKMFFQSEGFHKWDWLITLVFVSAYVILLSVYVLKKSPKVIQWVAIVCYILVIVECSLNMSETSVMTRSREAYFTRTEDYKALCERNIKYDEEFQRVECYDTMTDCDYSLYGYPSGSAFSSMLNTNVGRLYRRLGLGHGKVFLSTKDATPFCYSLLNVGYMISKSDKAEIEYYQKVDEQNGLFLYRSKYSLPFGYVAPVGFDLTDQSNAIVQQNDLVKKLGVEEQLFLEETVDAYDDELSFVVGQEGRVFGVLQNGDVSGVVVNMDGKGFIGYGRIKWNNILDLGHLKEGQFVSVRKEYESEGQKPLSMRFFCINISTLEKAIANLNERRMSDVEINNTSVRGHLELDTPGRLIMTIPYDKGWSVFVNGIEREVETFGDAFYAFDLEAGSYDIEMHYFPSGLKLGIGISLFSLLIFALLIFCGKKSDCAFFMKI